MMEEFNQEAALGVAGKLVSAFRDEQSYLAKNAQKVVAPPAVLRAAVFIQAVVRRLAFLKSFGTADIDPEMLELAPSIPMLTVGLFFSRRMRNRGLAWINAEQEAMTVAGVMTNKEFGLTMMDVCNCTKYYADMVSPSHMSQIILKEKLDFMLVQAKEYLQVKIEHLDQPVQIFDAIEHCKKKFQVPSTLHEQVVDNATIKLHVAIEEAEAKLRRDLAKASSVPAINA